MTTQKSLREGGGGVKESKGVDTGLSVCVSVFILQNFVHTLLPQMYVLVWSDIITKISDFDTIVLSTFVSVCLINHPDHSLCSLLII